MSLCPEAEFRASLDDADFWAHVFGGDDGPDDYDPDLDPNAPPPGRIASPCETCGAVDACGYDDEGRAWVHVTEDDT